MTTIVAERPQEILPHEYHWTADGFERACESGAFGHDRRLELIRGKVIDRMPESILHGFLAMLLTEYLRALLAPGFLVRAERLVRIAFDSDPVPDISVVRGGPFDYQNRHAAPEDVALLVEVAVSSAEYDLGEKALLYSQGGIADYWVVLPEREQIIVHREPSSDGYGSVMTLGLSDTVSPLVAEDAILSVRDLLGLGASKERTEQP